MFQKLKSAYKFLDMLFTNPNSPKGLRIRAARLEKKFGSGNPMVKALKKQADLKEEKAGEK